MNTEKIVILDTSMLMLPSERKINISYELERILPIQIKIVVPGVVIHELETLIKKSSPSIRQKARLALMLSKQFSLLDTHFKENADLEIKRLAEELNAIVATNDSELRLKLREKGIPVISIRGDNKLELFGTLE